MTLLSIKRAFVAGLFAGLLTTARAAEGFHAGPLFDRFSLTLAPGERTEALGPLFYSEAKETQYTWAIPPLFSYVHDPVTDFVEYDFGYPVLTYDRFGTEHRWQLFQLINFAGGENQSEQKA